MTAIRKVTKRDMGQWPGGILRVMVAPETMDDCEDAETVVTRVDGLQEVHVPWQPDEIDVVNLAHGATIWLTVRGGLPPHRIEVR